MCHSASILEKASFNQKFRQGVIKTELLDKVPFDHDKVPFNTTLNRHFSQFDIEPALLDK